jgi:hypothetical protein
MYNDRSGVWVAFAAHAHAAASTLPMKKRAFSDAERYAIWLCHEMRCWLCDEPLRLNETTIDHVLPEALLDDDMARSKILSEFGLAPDFNINDFENWLPCHYRCNLNKGRKVFKATPGIKLILDQLHSGGPKVRKVVGMIRAEATRDKTLARLLVGLEQGTITPADLEAALAKFGIRSVVPEPASMIHLDNGYWLHEDDVAYAGECQCERDACVDNQTKVYCFFSRMLSPWVVASKLYWKCYDEIIDCPRCAERHRRGHIGRVGACGRPYPNQPNRSY